MKFRKKPVVIEAFQYGIDPRPEWFNMHTVVECNVNPPTNDKPLPIMYCKIRTLEGTMIGNIGDYIIQGVQGELYPCKPDIFEATYEKV